VLSLLKKYSVKTDYFVKKESQILLDYLTPEQKVSTLIPELPCNQKIFQHTMHIKCLLNIIITVVAILSNRSS